MNNNVDNVTIPYDVVISALRSQVDQLNYEVLLRNARIAQLEEALATSVKENDDATAEG